MTSRAPRTSRPLLALLVPLALVLSGCGSSDGATDDGATDAAPAASTSAQDGHEQGSADHAEHGDDRAARNGDDRAGHGDDHTHAADPAAVLLRPRDLPAGYTSGHLHATAPTGDEPTPAACRPLAQLLRQPQDHGSGHDAGHGADHGSATTHGDHKASAVSYTRSHYGPLISQTVVDLGGFEPAATAVRRVRTAAQECDTYVQSTSRIGANTYAVAPLQAPEDAEPGAYLRLTARGDGSDGDIHWDVWVHDCEGMLVAVTFRSALGGDNADFWPAVSTVMDRVHGT